MSLNSHILPKSNNTKNGEELVQSARTTAAFVVSPNVLKIVIPAGSHFITNAYPPAAYIILMIAFFVRYASIEAGTKHLHLEPQREGLETQSAPEESEPSAIDKNTGHEVTDLGPAVQTATEGSQPTRRQRKSRYSTLPSNVDASLAVLYQELESVAMLRAEIEKLRTQNTQYAQTIKIQEQNQIALRRDLGALRENVTNSESTTKEIRELRERNAALEAELLVSKEQTAAAKELKERLAQLLNT
ncbi:hypothetical protein PEX1_051870 [Penicillium expansum]|uniref:Uncharacterized protein n=1 Tax=Penicillium expansum TaxID=27334 RepID=A0A0A2KH55_PENEN|nr:hypothetical protein PEX2_010400 [Penicillium expansum]KGO36860.1 hypothetical protein PEXP_006590 [Penicillium expansum]KGO51473.1 hypothetical protein PEX2_010400 [Penicillium expansum]KGO66283.1 hypothetical protein PEX1_051870 [Penicillium expansum]